MSYYIDIIDTLSNKTALKLENASAGGIVLKWNGGDSKDDLSVVASELNFNMLSPRATDATFINLFTGDEERFLVQILKSKDNAILWQGFILPDQYSEPYENGCFFVSFSAIDGLGRLKGKYLPEEYYSQEKSLINIYCQILKLTGLNLDLYFKPAIENFTNRDWNTIYIDTETFNDKKKKKTAYQILEILLKDTLCVCYQCDNRWYIEGLNVRHVRQVDYQVFDAFGSAKGKVLYTRLIKNVTALPTPTITMIPPYNEITVTHPKIIPSLAPSVSKEKNDGWAVATGVVGIIDASAWMTTGVMGVYCRKPDYQVGFYNGSSTQLGFHNGFSTAVFSTNTYQYSREWVSLRDKVFVSKGQKMNIKLKFKLTQTKADGLVTTLVAPADLAVWKNPFKYEIRLNDQVLFSNFSENNLLEIVDLVFEKNGLESLDLDFVFKEDGLLDLRIYRLFGAKATHLVDVVLLQEAKLEILEFEDEDVVTDLINAEFTIDKNIELTYGNDKSGVSKSFLLSKLKNETMRYTEHDCPILYGRVYDDKNYAIVGLSAANLIKKNTAAVYRDGALIKIKDVVYNRLGGEQMAIETSQLYDSGSFVVRKYAADDVLESRKHWVQWTDAIYKIENKTYAQIIANIYRRLFSISHEKLNISVKNAVKFNDIVLFDYVYKKDFYPINSSWNLDKNETTLTLVRSNYRTESNENNEGNPGGIIVDKNIAPIVVAADTIYLSDGQTTATISATAYDPDGYIAKQEWTLVSGSGTVVMENTSQLQTTVTNLNSDDYTFQIKVTDNGGATATDTLKLLRKKEHAVVLNLDLSNALDLGNVDRKKWELKVIPELRPDEKITFTGSLLIKASLFKRQILNEGSNPDPDAYGSYSITKNGAIIQKEDKIQAANLPILINYVAGDTVFIETLIFADDAKWDLNPGTNNAEFKLIIKAVPSDLVLTGLPIERSGYVENDGGGND